MAIVDAEKGTRIDGKRVIDMTLTEIGIKLREVTVIYNQSKRLLRALELEQDHRIKQLAESEHLEVVDSGAFYQVVNPRPEPSEFQATILNTFSRALATDDLALLTECYQLAISTRCHYTNWTTEFREGVMTAYERRKGEIEQEIADRAG